MALGRRESSHSTQLSALHSEAAVQGDYAPGQRVMTCDGIPGVVASIEFQPLMGAELYQVNLDGGAGGGLYSSSQLTPIASHVATGVHLASEDYPELDQILQERPDIALPTHMGSLHAEAAVVPTFQNETEDYGGTAFGEREKLHAHHPETGERMGTLTYLVPRRKSQKLRVEDLTTRGEHRRQGVGSALMDEMQRRHPGQGIDHGDRTDNGKAWWNSYTDGKSVNKGRTMASLHTASEDEDYRMHHRPVEDGPPAHDLGSGMAGDVYTHPHYWASGGTPSTADREGLAQLRKAKGNPEHPVTIYRASPPGAPHVMNTGDWVSLSHSYAKEHAGYRHEEDGGTGEAWTVHKATVPAKHVRDAGTDVYKEQGYWGPSVPSEAHTGRTGALDPYTEADMFGPQEEQHVAGRGKPRADGRGAGPGTDPEDQFGGAQRAVDPRDEHVGQRVVGAAPVTFHPAAMKELKKLDNQSRKQVGSVITDLEQGRPTQTHQLGDKLKGWSSTKASRGHRIVHRKDEDGSHYIGHVGLHEYETAIRRLTFQQLAIGNYQDYDDKKKVYLRFGQIPKDERSDNNVTGGKEDGVSVYDLNHHGEPEDPDPGMNREHEHDQHCEDDCDLDANNSDYHNDTAEEMQGRVHRAEQSRRSGRERAHDAAHLVRGEMVGIGHDGEPLLRNVKHVGDWMDHRHLFIPTAKPHRLARDPEDEDYIKPKVKPPAPPKTATQQDGGFEDIGDASNEDGIISDGLAPAMGASDAEAMAGSGGHYDDGTEWAEDGYPADGRRKAAFNPYTALTEAAFDPEFRFHFTSAWSDVRAKAKRIRAEGGVRITLASDGLVIGEVKGDHHVYETGVQRFPGSRNSIATYSCGCKWGAYHWGASDDFSRFAGRMCSHALALQFEAQSKGMFGRDIVPETRKPEWVPRKVVVKYDIDDGDNRFGKSSTLEVTPLLALARWARAQGDDAEEFAFAVRTAGLEVTAAVNSPWGDPQPQAMSYQPGPTKPPNPSDNPGSAGWATMGDPDSWDSITPNELGDRVGHLEEELAFEAAIPQEVAQGDNPQGLQGLDDADGWDQMSMSASVTIDLSEAAREMFRSAFHDGGPDRPSGPKGGTGGDMPPGHAGMPEHDVLSKGPEATLNMEPEGALPFTDGDSGVDLSDDESLTPSHTAAVGLEALQAMLGHLNPAGAAPEVTAADATAYVPEGDIAAAARQHLAKVAVKDYSPSEQAAIINEGKGVRAANLDRLDIKDTHYAHLDEEDGDGSWLN